MVNVGIIGCGYWGSNLIRNFSYISDCRVYALSDLLEDRLKNIHLGHQRLITTTNYKELLNNSEIEAIVIATPVRSHYTLAKESLLANKHVLVEKPLATSIKECQELIDLANKRKRTLMVSHTFLYNPAVRKLKELISTDMLGEIFYLYAQRLNLGIVRQDVDAMWNLAPHDISIILYLLEKEPVEVSANGFSYIQNELDDVTFIFLRFENGVVAHIHVSWLDPNKIRRLTVVGAKKMAVYDDVSLDAKIQIFDRGVDKINDNSKILDDFGEFQLQIRSGDVVIPTINFIEPLRNECVHFIDCITYKKTPLTDGLNGLRVVRVLEAAHKSLKNQGRLISLNSIGCHENRSSL